MKRKWTGPWQPPVTFFHVSTFKSIINFSCVQSHRSYCNKHGYKLKWLNWTIRLMSHNEMDRLATQTAMRRWRRMGGSLFKLFETKGFPQLKKNAAAVLAFGFCFIRHMEICSWGICFKVWGDSKWSKGMSRAEQNRDSRGVKTSTESPRQAPLFMQHKMLTHLFQRFFQKPRLWFCVSNWLSSFEKKVQSTCLTWFRGLCSLKWKEASNSIASRSIHSHHVVLQFLWLNN